MNHSQPTVFVVDDDPMLRKAMTIFLASENLNYTCYPDAISFLADYQPEWPGCLLLDIDIPELNGLELQTKLVQQAVQLPIIFLTGQANVSKTVQAFKKGAYDLIEKPANNELLLTCIHHAIARDVSLREIITRKKAVQERLQRLTPREYQVMIKMTEGKSNKLIARELDISCRTVEGHRRMTLEKMQANSLAALIEMTHLVEIPSR